LPLPGLVELALVLSVATTLKLIVVPPVCAGISRATDEWF